MNNTETKPEDIRLESSLLKAMSRRKNFDTFAEFIDVKRLLPNTGLLLKDYKKYFDSFAEHGTIDWGTFTTEFGQHWHTRDLDEDDIVYYRDTVIPLIDQVEEQDVNGVLVGLLDRDYSNRLTDLLNSGVDSTKLQETLDSYNQAKAKYVTQTDAEAFSIDKIDFSILDKENGIPWFLPSLQKGLGSLVQGQFVVVAADYGVGKSAFVISQLAHTLKYLRAKGDSRPVLYFNSEGTQADVFTRTLSNLYNNKVCGGFEDILKQVDTVTADFIEKFNKDTFLVFQIQQGDMSKIKQKIDMYKPSVVIIDIMDVLAKEEDVQHLKKLYDGLRLLSAQSCPIIGTTQSGNTSYQYFDKEKSEMVTKHRRWLSEKDLYGSKAGKGGAADTIITIGKDDDMPHIRYVHTPKKKRGTVVSVTCEIVEKYSVYKELL